MTGWAALGTEDDSGVNLLQAKIFFEDNVKDAPEPGGSQALVAVGRRPLPLPQKMEHSP